MPTWRLIQKAEGKELEEIKSRTNQDHTTTRLGNHLLKKKNKKLGKKTSKTVHFQDSLVSVVACGDSAPNPATVFPISQELLMIEQQTPSVGLPETRLAGLPQPRQFP